MLDTIKQLETELADQIARAKHDAATAVQAARTEAADGRAALEERLRAEEQALITAAEAKATAEADAITNAAKKTAPTVATERSQALAKQLLAPFIS